MWAQDQTYSFTIARLLEGFLRIDSLTVNGINMIVGGIDQGVTPLVHPGASVNVSMTVSNQGELVDDFLIEVYKDGTLYETSLMIPSLPVGSNVSYSPNSFVMPNANVNIEIRTFHEEEKLGLISWWKFNEGSGNIANDSIGNNHGIIYGATWVNDPERGIVLNLNGVDNYVDCGSDTSLNITNAITISLWINPNSTQEYCWDGTTGNYGVAGKVGNATASTNWSWQLRYGSPDSCRLGFQFNEAGAGSKWITVKQNLTPSTWYHIVATFDGANIKCYLNGIEKDTNTLLGIEGYLNKLLIGSEGWANYFDGLISEIKIWDRALTQDEIIEEYT